MWLFGVFELLGLVGVLVLIFCYCFFLKQKFFSFIWKHLKWVGLAIVVIWLLIAILCWHHLYSAMQCSFRGISMKANTKYSIYLGECQIETPRGSFVPIDRARSIPDGSKTDDAGNSDEYYGN